MTRFSVMLVGAGRVAMHLAQQFRSNATFLACGRQFANTSCNQTWVPLIYDLDQAIQPRSLALTQYIVYLVPPNPQDNQDDTRLRHFLANIMHTTCTSIRLVYISTTGVYGDHQGGWVNENTAKCPCTARAYRRHAAEKLLHTLTAQGILHSCILRVPGIYAQDRLPMARLKNQLPVLKQDEDIWSSHIHMDDLVWGIWYALFRGAANRIYNLCDNFPLKTTDYFNMVARFCGLDMPKEVTKAELMSLCTPMQRSFLSQSRRVSNHRARRELRWNLRYPSVSACLEKLDY